MPFNSAKLFNPFLCFAFAAGNDCVNWKAACMNLEEQQERWSNMQSTMKHISWKDLHVAAIDAIMLINVS